MPPWTLKYVLLFLLIQLVNLPLMVFGWFVCLLPSLAKRTWICWNDDDGAGPNAGWWNQYVWLAWRNPVANLRHVRGVSAVGRPLYYRTGLLKGKQFYFKAGWMSNGYPCLSFGSGRGY